MQANGLDIISNEEIRTDIINLYEYAYPLLYTNYDKAEWNISQTVVNPFLSKHVREFNQSSTQRRARPNNFESLKKNDEFSNILEMIITQRQTGLGSYFYTMKSIEKLIQSLDTEIKSRS